ncbi:MAG: hypothetical protein HQL82_07615 [Magnetococcales bacterium]|nr:hypothetical protein [Magnetococcales bacterium]
MVWHLIVLGLWALVALVAVVVDQAGPAGRAHWILAVGLFPLMTGMMIHFTAVLTRSGPARGWIRGVPLAALAAGLAAFWAVTRNPVWILVAAPLGLGVVGSLWLWTVQRARGALGGPHPGLLWYQGALLVLALGLLAILAAALQPEWWLPLRSLHLHLNLVGFMGLTAVGTLQVLLPTVGRYQDSAVNRRLQVDFKYALAGTLATGLGAAGWHVLSGVGLLLWTVPLGRLGGAVIRHLPWRAANGATLSLVGALAGFTLVLWSGLPIALGWVAAVNAVPLFFLLFLFPLLTGALSHLWPLWWWQGDGSRQERGQVLLARWGGVRALVFLGAGFGLMAGASWALYLGLAGLTQFGVQGVITVLRLAEGGGEVGSDGPGHGQGRNGQ